jgi:adenylate cyclase class 2
LEYKAGMQTTLEREVKLRFESADAARAIVEAAEATPLRCRRLQEDYLLDDAIETLRHRRCVLRVRIESGRNLLTFKGPVQPSPMKLREEIETIVGDGETMLRCLDHLGYRVWFRYQKYREEYALGDVTIAIDETPVGVFVEIEGSEQGITDAARALGRGPDDYLLDSYRALFMEYRRARGLPPTDMIFDDGEMDD